MDEHFDPNPFTAIYYDNYLRFTWLNDHVHQHDHFYINLLKSLFDAVWNMAMSDGWLAPGHFCLGDMGPMESLQDQDVLERGPELGSHGQKPSSPAYLLWKHVADMKDMKRHKPLKSNHIKSIVGLLQGKWLLEAIGFGCLEPNGSTSKWWGWTQTNPKKT